MEFSVQNYVSVNDIKADVLMILDDEAQKKFNPGFYTSQIQQALQELSFDTYFLHLYKDIKFPSDTLSLELPKGAFNVKQVYVFNGDECSVESSQNVYIKSGYITKGTDKGHTAQNKEGNIDQYRNTFNNRENILYCSFQNGHVMFSSNCSGYDMVRIEYNGIQTDLGDTPIIPMQYREAVKMFLEEKCYRVLKGKNPRLYSTIHRDVYNQLYADYVGVWAKAEYRAKTMDSKTSQDLKEYLNKLNY